MCDDDFDYTGACENCAGTDYIIDYERGDRVCSGCGAVDSRLMVSAASFKEQYDRAGCPIFQAPLSESYRSGAYHESASDAMAVAREELSPVKSAPYKAITYFAERISQWRSKEPAIPAGDWRIIEDQHNVFTGWLQDTSSPHYVEPVWTRERVLSKEDIRLLLWEIDKQQPSVTGRFFVKKYLEKFLTIRLFLCGRSSTGARVTEDIVMALKELFGTIVVPFIICVRSEGLRYSLINYNFLFRRFFDLLDLSHLGVDFPPLKSKKKRDDVCILWLKIVSFLKLPYINSDGALFGDQHATPVAQLVAIDRRRASGGGTTKPTRKRKATYTNGNSNRLRRQRAHDEDQQDSGGMSYERLRRVFSACGGSVSDWDRGHGNGHN